MNDSADQVPAGLLPRWRRSAGRALDLIFPPQCCACSALIEPGGALCPDCWRDMAFLGPPQCDACGVPFEFDIGERALCGACARQRPNFRRARAVSIYNETSRKLILGFKHGDRTELAPHLGRWLARAGSELIAGADIIVPVPLHWTRLFSRRFNQSALLAHAMARETGIRLRTDALIRRRRTLSLGRMSPSQRTRTLAGAFGLNPGAIGDVKAKTVLLVDDVMTSGATATGCTRALRAAGAAEVDVLTLARVVRDPV